MNRKFSNSIRKYIRIEKARIRREVLEVKEQTKKIQELYSRLAMKREDSKTSSPTKTKKLNSKKNENKRNTRAGDK